jgi:hypothetical protein
MEWFFKKGTPDGVPIIWKQLQQKKGNKHRQHDCCLAEIAYESFSSAAG